MGATQRADEPAVEIWGGIVHEMVKGDLTKVEIDDAAQRFTGGESPVSITVSFGVGWRHVRAAL